MIIEPANVLFNPSAENGLNYWTARNGASIVTDVAHDGQHSFQLVADASKTTKFDSDSYSFGDPRRNCRLVAWVKTDGAIDAKLMVSLTGSDGSSSWRAIDIASTQGWERVSAVMDLGKPIVSAQVRLIIGNAGTMWVDDVSLIPSLPIGRGPLAFYLSQHTGSDENFGMSPETPLQSAALATANLIPGDTLYIMGELSNPSRDPQYQYSGPTDSQLWHKENTLLLKDIHGTPSAYITITAYNESAVLRGNGENIVKCLDVSYVRITNVTIEGDVDRISVQMAEALMFIYTIDIQNISMSNLRCRVNPEGGFALQSGAQCARPAHEVNALANLPILDTEYGSAWARVSYTNTRGIYITGAGTHHVELVGNKVTKVCGAGIAVTYCKYVKLLENEVSYTTMRSFMGTHAIYINEIADADRTGEYVVEIERNRVHHNYNEIYSWVGSKDFIHAKIDEGKGISIQRCSNFGQLGGRILVRNNLAYWNGFSGIHSQDSDNLDVIHNTAYMNHYTNTFTNAQNPSGKATGISAQGTKGSRYINNLVVINQTLMRNYVSGRPYALMVDSSSSQVTTTNNLIWGHDQLAEHDTHIQSAGTYSDITNADPQLADPSAFDFHPLPSSPAIGMASVQWTPAVDLDGRPRSAPHIVGALNT